MSSDKPADIAHTGASAYKSLLKLAFNHKRYFAFALIGMVVFALSEAAFAYLIKPMLDEGFINRDPNMVLLIPLAIVGIFVVRMIAVFLRAYCMDYIGRQVINELRGKLFDKLMTLKTEEYDQMSSALIVSKFSFDVEQIARAVSHSLTIFIQDTLRVIALFGYMLWLSLELSLIFLVAGPLVFFIIVKLSGRFRKISRNIQESIGHVSHIAQETIDSNRVVRIFGGINYERDKFRKANELNLRQNLKLSVAKAISTPLTQLIIAMAFASIVSFATSDTMQGKITSGDFMSFIFALTMLLVPMRSLSTINANIQKGIAAGESIYAFIAKPSEIDEGKKELKAVKGDVEFCSVSLVYNKHTTRVLNELSFKASANQTVAIVGRSGSGKSSLVNLLPRLYEYTSGDILIDGESIRDYSLESLREHIAYVGQDVRLFNDTIRNNIAYGSLNKYSEQALQQAIEQAYATDFINGLPDGIETVVGEKGVLLSGGQRQRIAIARALLKNAPILILDEATSALDTESERHIQDALQLLMKNRTTLVIAHRLSTIEHADNILVLDNGQIVEQGNHQQLINKQGHYAQLHAIQFSEPSSDENDANEKDV